MCSLFLLIAKLCLLKKNETEKRKEKGNLKLGGLKVLQQNLVYETHILLSHPLPQTVEEEAGPEHSKVRASLLN